jgi:hypothetical protein
MLILRGSALVTIVGVAVPEPGPGKSSAALAESARGVSSVALNIQQENRKFTSSDRSPGADRNASTKELALELLCGRHGEGVKDDREIFWGRFAGSWRGTER